MIGKGDFERKFSAKSMNTRFLANHRYWRFTSGVSWVIPGKSGQRTIFMGPNRTPMLSPVRTDFQCARAAEFGNQSDRESIPNRWPTVPIANRLCTSAGAHVTSTDRTIADLCRSLHDGLINETTDHCLHTNVTYPSRERERSEGYKQLTDEFIGETTRNQGNCCPVQQQWLCGFSIQQIHTFGVQLPAGRSGSKPCGFLSKLKDNRISAFGFILEFDDIDRLMRFARKAECVRQMEVGGPAQAVHRRLSVGHGCRGGALWFEEVRIHRLGVDEFGVC